MKKETTYRDFEYIEMPDCEEESGTVFQYHWKNCDRPLGGQAKTLKRMKTLIDRFYSTPNPAAPAK